LYQILLGFLSIPVSETPDLSLLRKENGEKVSSVSSGVIVGNLYDSGKQRKRAPRFTRGALLFAGVRKNLKQALIIPPTL
jgi:hypothetical protein